MVKSPLAAPSTTATIPDWVTVARVGSLEVHLMVRYSTILGAKLQKK